MSNLVKFDFNQNQVRVVVGEDGEPWFVAKDVADILGHRDANTAMRALNENEKGTHPVRTLGGNQNMTVITESGLYKLVMRSDKSEARQFQTWVTSEVLPSIRKTGSYSAQPQFELPKTYLDALKALVVEVEKTQILEAANKQMLPKAEVYDAYISSSSLMSMSEAAKLTCPHTGLGRNKLFAALREEGIFTHNSLPAQAQIDNGNFLVKEVRIPNMGDNSVRSQAFVTQKGLEFILKKFSLAPKTSLTAKLAQAATRIAIKAN